MNLKCTCILGGCIIIAAAILTVAPKFLNDRRISNQVERDDINRFQISNPGEQGYAFVIDTTTGQIWRMPVGMSGATDGERFFEKKL